MTNSFYFSIVFFLVFFNQLSKFLFFCQTIIFFTCNECFSHFNVQQLSTLKHKSSCFVFTSSFENNIENESIQNFEFRILRYVLHSSVFFGARLENPKINKRGWGGGGGPNNSRGVLLFFQKNKQEARLFATLEYSIVRIDFQGTKVG